MADVIVLKMSNGDEIIATSSNLKSDNYIVDKPRVLQMMQGQHGVQAGLVPYIMSDPDKTDIVIKSNHVVCSFLASNDLAKSYLQSVSSIQLLG